ncbi:hypothetical protein CDD80_1454 [Ophiocordyceps camponoti-rufipedis]|uniref:Protein kinase domain-containing protein n=1 Tax=Ophiocordyceps camponoti-rufipedis TaxID=2004952 RepID=A0A2C5Y1R3_9HYPO|nr:hypothetical protein CDD80_1454 [Ophiocordyceps camponoti-rufipedis]
MAVEVATLKPLFPGGNEVDQVWRVCEVMGSPGNWYNKSGVRIGGGDWREGNKLAGKLGFSFPKMAPHAMETILQPPQWPPALSSFVTWCLMWDPKHRPTSSQALMHDYFHDAVDPLRPRSSASRALGRKQSDLRGAGHPASGQSKPSWFRKSLIGRAEVSEQSLMHVQIKENAQHRPSPHHGPEAPLAPGRQRPAGGKRSTWTNGVSNNAAPMPILPTIRPISPLSDAVTARANNNHNGQGDVGANGRGQEKSKKVGRQLSVASSTNHYADANCAEMHRLQAERALNGNTHTGLASPPSGHKESFFSHLRKRARRFSGRHQTPVSPSYDDMEAQIGCGPWSSNRSSVVVEQQPTPAASKPEAYESLDRALRDVQANIELRSQVPTTHQHYTSGSGKLKRHHSLPHHQPRSVDNLIGAARCGPVSSRTRRAQAAAQGVRQYEAPAEEDEFLDEMLPSTKRADGGKPLRQSVSNLGLTTPQPYPSPSPSASGNQVLFGDGQEAVTPRPLDLGKKADSQYKWPTPPYEGSEWAASASASIWAASNRF